MGTHGSLRSKGVNLNKNAVTRTYAGNDIDAIRFVDSTDEINFAQMVTLVTFRLPLGSILNRR